MRFESLLESIGHTPLVRLRGTGRTNARIFAKLELMNPFGMKDRFAYNAVLKAKATGELKEGGIIIESSSGTLAVGLAMVGRALGHEVYIVTDPRIDTLTLAKLRALGAVVYIVEHMTEGGWQGARLEKLHQLMIEHPGAFWPRQYSNINNPQTYAMLAQELLEDLDHVDVLIGPVGSGGSLCGSARALKGINPDLFVVGIDAVGSVIFDQPHKPHRLQSGLGNSLVPENVDKSVIDQVHWLNDEEAFIATWQLAANEQIFAGNSSGSAYWVACWISTQYPSDRTIVVILPDRGDRYYNTIYNPQYCEIHNIGQRNLSDSPIKILYGTEVLSWSYANLRE